MGQVVPGGHKFCGFEDRKNVASIRRSLTIRLSQEIAKDYSRPAPAIFCGVVNVKRSGVIHLKVRTDHLHIKETKSPRKNRCGKEKWL